MHEEARVHVIMLDFEEQKKNELNKSINKWIKSILAILIQVFVVVVFLWCVVNLGASLSRVH